MYVYKVALLRVRNEWPSEAKQTRAFAVYTFASQRAKEREKELLCASFCTNATRAAEILRALCALS
jgi:hypothetical protein